MISLTALREGKDFFGTKGGRYCTIDAVEYVFDTPAHSLGPREVLTEHLSNIRGDVAEPFTPPLSYKANLPASPYCAAR